MENIARSAVLGAAVGGGTWRMLAVFCLANIFSLPLFALIPAIFNGGGVTLAGLLPLLVPGIRAS